ncbi:hypothetical protein ND22_003627 [Escherichia coli]|nr:hypothetical protein [Escherichia coli]
MDKETEMSTDNAVSGADVSGGTAASDGVQNESKPRDVIKLSVPLVRGDVSYSEIKIGPLARQAGSLRGLSLIALYNINFDAMVTWLARVTEPKLKESEMHAMNMVDFSALSTAAVSFFAPSGSNAPKPENTAEQ